MVASTTLLIPRSADKLRGKAPDGALHSHVERSLWCGTLVSRPRQPCMYFCAPEPSAGGSRSRQRLKRLASESLHELCERAQRLWLQKDWRQQWQGDEPPLGVAEATAEAGFHPPAHCCKPREQAAQRLQQGRQDHPSPGVFLAPFQAVKELPEALVLRERPLDHLVRSTEAEDGRRQRLSRHREAHPAPDLKGVVGARHKVEQPSPGDAVPGGLVAQAGEIQMGQQVAHLQARTRGGCGGLQRGLGAPPCAWQAR